MAVDYQKAVRTNPHKVHHHNTSRDKFVRNTGEGLVSNPIKTDYPDTTREHDDLVVDLSSTPHVIPTRATRDESLKFLDTIMSARSKRELRQLIEYSDVQMLTTIQVNDQGKYFVYVEPEVTLEFDDCVTATPIQRLEDLTFPPSSCPAEAPQRLEASTISETTEGYKFPPQSRMSAGKSVGIGG